MSKSDTGSVSTKVEERESPIHERGLFALGPIAKGVRVAGPGAREKLNHSCEPNLAVQGDLEFVTMADVAAGSELLIDYATIDDGDYEMFCDCGTRSCRGVVKGSDWKKIDVRAMYEGQFAKHIQDRIDKIK